MSQTMKISPPSSITAGALTAFIVASIFYLYQYVIRTVPGTFLPEIQSSLGIDLGTASGMVGALMYTYGAGCLLTGPILDKFGVRRALPFGALFIGTGSLMMASDYYEIVAAGRIVQGAGCAFAFVACAFIAAKYLPVAVLALATGAAQSFGMSGGSLGGKPLADFAAFQGWDFSQISLILGGIGLVFTVAIFLIMPRQRPGEGEGVAFVAPLKAVLSNPQSWLLGFVAGAMFAPTTVGDMALGMTFFHKVYHFSTFGSSLVTLLPLGWVVGAPLMGWLSDYIGSRKLVIIPSIILLLCMSVYTRVTDLATVPHAALAAIMFTYGIFSGSAMVAYAAIKEANPPEYAGTSSGVINALNFTMGALLSSLIGWLIKAYALDASGNVLSVESFGLATLPIPIMLALALPVVFFVKETGARKN
ncbi:MFS transporter [Desulfobulbus sp.]|uniref:MFS transporter n=1 Tax=Desulfobulbus sp. TaxID=895 RepID=UPI00286EF10F|nr:MFS transporter [Desulfobulbus sp.]